MLGKVDKLRAKINNENKSDKKKEKVCWNCNEPGHFKNKCPVAEDADERNLTETLMEDECWIIEEDSQRAVFSKTVLSEEEEVFVAKLVSVVIFHLLLIFQPRLG